MVQSRLIGASFLLAMSASLAGAPPALPRGTEMRSLLDDLAPDGAVATSRRSTLWEILSSLVSSPDPSERCSSASLKTIPQAEADLKSLAAAEVDFRGCDRDWHHVNDFWTADIRGLYERTSREVPEAHENNREGCHVNDFWTANVVGLYTLTSAAAAGSIDPAIKLIELSVAAVDEEDP